MKRVASVVVLSGLSAALAWGAGGCGGTSSETPWPVEPLDVDLRPEADRPPEDRGPVTKAVAVPPEETAPENEAEKAP